MTFLVASKCGKTSIAFALPWHCLRCHQAIPELVASFGRKISRQTPDDSDAGFDRQLKTVFKENNPFSA